MNVLSRIVRCRELLEDGALDELGDVLRDLELDLVGGRDRQAFRCCGESFRCSCELRDHEFGAHFREAA